MKAPLSIADHEVAASHIAGMNERIHELLHLISNRRGVTARELDQLLRIDRNVMQFRSRMEDVLFREHARTASTSVYYGTSDESQTRGTL